MTGRFLEGWEASEFEERTTYIAQQALEEKKARFRTYPV